MEHTDELCSRAHRTNLLSWVPSYVVRSHHRVIARTDIISVGRRTHPFQRFSGRKKVCVGGDHRILPTSWLSSCSFFVLATQPVDRRRVLRTLQISDAATRIKNRYKARRFNVPIATGEEWSFLGGNLGGRHSTCLKTAQVPTVKHEVRVWALGSSKYCHYNGSPCLLVSDSLPSLSTNHCCMIVCSFLWVFSTILLVPQGHSISCVSTNNSPWLPFSSMVYVPLPRSPKAPGTSVRVLMPCGVSKKPEKSLYPYS